MKKNLTFRILTLAAALLVAVMTFASCSAPSGDMIPDLGPADQNTAGGMEGGKPSDLPTGSLNGDYDRKIIRTVTMSC
jgi:hypothetical protein